MDLTQRREKIVSIATRMFIEQGYAATTLEAIGAAAGVTKRTMYELVGDKQAIFAAACNSMRAEGPGFQFDIVLTDRSAQDVMHQMARQLINHCLEKELITLERAVIAEAVNNEQIVRISVGESRDNQFLVISKIFDALIAADLLAPMETLTAARIFYDATVGARGFRAVLGLPPEAASDEEIELRINMFIHGYINRIAPGR
jgi:TetR/AcrR family transcriptional regulator, mexJK operon transcriptional repressor